MFSVFMIVRHQELPWCEAINIVRGPNEGVVDRSDVPSGVGIEGVLEYFDLRTSLVPANARIRIREMVDSVYIDRILILRVGYEVDAVGYERAFESF